MSPIRYVPVPFDASASSSTLLPLSRAPAQPPDSSSATTLYAAVPGDAHATFACNAAAATLPLTESLLHRLREAGL